MSRTLWDRYREYVFVHAGTGLQVDVSRVGFEPSFFASMEPRVVAAYVAMDALEAGGIANRDEQRMVGHYWLRDADRAPTPEIRHAITDTLARIRTFVHDVHAGRVRGAGGSFAHLLVIGIGGSALGPQFVSDALATSQDRMRLHFLDNTDPDGIDRAMAAIGDELDRTLVCVISKSGGTKETRNGMLEAAEAYRRAGLPFSTHAVAVTGAGSALDQHAQNEGWIARFPMWDWVGGRTSVCSAVGLLPAALQGLDIDAFLAGARAADAITRTHNTRQNPAALLALMWYSATSGRGTKDMVILPYKDRLALLSRYLQQLVMESLGKATDRDGHRVEQGISVFGNKGSTDQHAYVQQLREGVNNFFVTFVEVLADRHGRSMPVEEGSTSGDYLSGFFLGTRQALFENHRASITITIPDVTPTTVGVLIAVYERAVGLYAELINVNAYDQPGVEAGKKAAAAVLALQGQVLAFVRTSSAPQDVESIAAGIGAADDIETIFKILEHVSANVDHGVTKHPGPTLFDARYSASTVG